MTASVTSPSNITSLNQNTPVPHVVNNYYGSPTAPSVNNSGTDLLTGMVLGGLAGAALSNNNYRDHDTVIIERAPAAPVAPRRDSSWDEDTAPPAPSRRDTSWDDDSSKSSSSRDSSWDSGSSSSDSSSWDSGSSSSGSSDW